MRDCHQGKVFCLSCNGPSENQSPITASRLARRRHPYRLPRSRFEMVVLICHHSTPSPSCILFPLWRLPYSHWQDSPPPTTAAPPIAPPTAMTSSTMGVLIASIRPRPHTLHLPQNFSVWLKFVGGENQILTTTRLPGKRCARLGYTYPRRS